jgi:GNAT superfamily N-acetyltransferase
VAQARGPPGVSADAPAGLIERHQTELATRWTQAQGGEVWEDDDLVLTIAGLQVSFTNNVHRTRLSPETVEGRVADVVALLGERKVPALWWVGPLDTPAELPEVLEANGFKHEEDMPWMAADLATDPGAALPDGVEAFRVDGPERFEQFVDAMKRGFGMDENEQEAMIKLDDVVGTGEDAGWQRFVAIEDGRPVGSSGLMLGEEVAGIYNVATPPEHRGRGIAGALTGVAMRWARDHGFGTAILGSAPKAVPLYERMGFRHVCRMGVYVFEP